VYSQILEYNDTDKVGSNYWDKVDERLKLYRSKAKNKPQDVQQYFISPIDLYCFSTYVYTIRILLGILDDDKKKYGLSGPEYTISPGSSGHFQQMVDDMLSEGVLE
jgi:hypothetical protein